MSRGRAIDGDACEGQGRQAEVHGGVQAGAERGSQAAVAANEEVVPVSLLREAQQRIKELERALGRKTMEIEILHAARDEVKKRPHYYGVSKK